MVARRKSKAAAQHPTALYPAFEDGEAFDKLKTLIKSGRPPIALIGAGASAKSGYPTWTQLIQLLQSAASKKTKAGQWKKNLDDVNDAPWTAEVFARDLGPGGLGKLIRKEFATRQSLAEPHIALAKMPFPHFLTTNFDPSIEEALRAVKREYTVVSWRDDMAVSDFLINLGHPDNRTRVLVTLTDEGWQTFTAAVRESDMVESDVLGPLSRPQREDLAALLELLIKGLDEPAAG